MKNNFNKTAKYQTLFKCKWFDTNPKKKTLLTYKNIARIFINSEWSKDDPFILSSQAK